MAGRGRCTLPSPVFGAGQHAIGSVQLRGSCGPTTFPGHCLDRAITAVPANLAASSDPLPTAQNDPRLGGRLARPSRGAIAAWAEWIDSWPRAGVGFPCGFGESTPKLMLRHVCRKHGSTSTNHHRPHTAIARATPITRLNKPSRTSQLTEERSPRSGAVNNRATPRQGTNDGQHLFCPLRSATVPTIRVGATIRPPTSLSSGSSVRTAWCTGRLQGRNASRGLTGSSTGP